MTQVNRGHLAGLKLALDLADTVTTDSIGIFELQTLIAQANAAPEQEAAFVMPSCEGNYDFGYVDGTCIQSLRRYRDHLEEIVDSIPQGNLYTHADPSEVERLRADLAACWAEFKALMKSAEEKEKHLNQQLSEAQAENESLLRNLKGKHALTGATYELITAERDRLQKQLFEAKALLQSATYVVDRAREIDRQAFGRGASNIDVNLLIGLGKLLEQHDAFLSATAQPAEVKS